VVHQLQDLGKGDEGFYAVVPGLILELLVATASTRTELVIRDGAGKLVYRFTLPCDPVADPTYLKALVAGQSVAAIACEGPGSSNVFYARSLDDLRKWAEDVRRGAT
jgi:hypothetical protein